MSALKQFQLHGSRFGGFIFVPAQFSDSLNTLRVVVLPVRDKKVDGHHRRQRSEINRRYNELEFVARATNFFLRADNVCPHKIEINSVAPIRIRSAVRPQRVQCSYSLAQVLTCSCSCSVAVFVRLAIKTPPSVTCR